MPITTVAESLYWSYANLAMAHAAVNEGARSYGRMNLGAIAGDERLKLVLPPVHRFLAAK